MRTIYEIDTTTPGHWRAVNDRRWMEADGAELTCSDPNEFETWLVRGQAVWSPTGPALDYPCPTAAGALAITLVYLDAVTRTAPDSVTVVTGDMPEVSSLWLDSGQDDTGTVY